MATAPSPSPSASPWIAELDCNDHVPSLQEGSKLPSEVDIVIVGAGMTGCALAYHLAQLSRSECASGSSGPWSPPVRVLVLDARCVSGGASGRNGGLMWPSGEEPFELRTAAQLREFCAEHQVDGRWVGGSGVSVVDCEEEKNLGLEENEVDDDDEEGEVLLGGLEAIDPVEVLGARPCAFQPTAYKDERVFSFWPAKVVRGLARAAVAGGESSLHAEGCHGR